MKQVFTLLAAIFASSLLWAVASGCSASDVAARQQSISNTQGDILDRRAARIQARDERMSASRDVWFQ